MKKIGKPIYEIRLSLLELLNESASLVFYFETITVVGKKRFRVKSSVYV